MESILGIDSVAPVNAVSGCVKEGGSCRETKNRDTVGGGESGYIREREIHVLY
jgi:hypothetical protein